MKPEGSRVRDLAGGPVTIWVPGRARTKGSLKPVHIRTGAGQCKVVLREDGEFSVAWKRAMIAAIRAQALCARWPHAVRVDLTFVFEREGGDVSPWPTGHQYGDVDKLERNALDALTQSGLIFDDALVVDGTRRKMFADIDWPEPGVHITVAPVAVPA